MYWICCDRTVRMWWLFFHLLVVLLSDCLQWESNHLVSTPLVTTLWVCAYAASSACRLAYVTIMQVYMQRMQQLHMHKGYGSARWSQKLLSGWRQSKWVSAKLCTVSVPPAVPCTVTVYTRYFISVFPCIYFAVAYCVPNSRAVNSHTLSVSLTPGHYFSRSYAKHVKSPSWMQNIPPNM